MGEVKNFSVIAAQPSTSAEIIEILEGMLEKAKSGEMVGLAYAYVTRTDECRTGWEAMKGEENNTAVAIMRLHHRYVHESTFDD